MQDAFRPILGLISCAGVYMHKYMCGNVHALHTHLHYTHICVHIHMHAHTHAHICTHKNIEGYCYPITCHLNAWNSNPHLLVTPAQLMRHSTYAPTKLTCALGEFVQQLSLLHFT